MLQVSPSILTADFAHLAYEIKKIERGGADQIHVDVMDGQFVPNMSLGPCIVKSLSACSVLPLDVHLMIQTPENMIPAFAKAGADTITVHIEVCPDLAHTIELIHSLGCKAGVSINPETDVNLLKPYVGLVDLILVMSVHPGFGGQSFMPMALERLSILRRWISESGREVDLEVDGGIKASNLEAVRDAGANIFVLGSAIYDGIDPEANMKQIKKLLLKEE